MIGILKLNAKKNGPIRAHTLRYKILTKTSNILRGTIARDYVFPLHEMENATRRYIHYTNERKEDLTRKYGETTTILPLLNLGGEINPPLCGWTMTVDWKAPCLATHLLSVVKSPAEFIKIKWYFGVQNLFWTTSNYEIINQILPQFFLTHSSVVVLVSAKYHH